MRKSNHDLPSSILENTTNITDIYSATPGKFSSEPTLYILVVVLLILSLILVLVADRMKYSSRPSDDAQVAVITLAPLCAITAALLLLYANEKAPNEWDVTEQLHQDILISNHFDMDVYKLNDVNYFGDNGSILHWKDINSGDVSFFTWHSDSSDVDHIEISIVDGYNIRTVEPSDSHSFAE